MSNILLLAASVFWAMSVRLSAAYSMRLIVAPKEDLLVFLNDMPLSVIPSVSLASALG